MRLRPVDSSATGSALRSVLCLLLSIAAPFGEAQTLPHGPVVVSGSATISSGGGSVTITNSPGAIINWQSFSIGAGNAAQFIQQSAASAVLNRVVSSAQSSIMGSLSSNGKVFLINPNGVVFGPGSSISVGSIAVSTLNASDASFLSGTTSFTGSGNSGTIELAGSLATTQGGYAVLLAPALSFSGSTFTAQTGMHLVSSTAARLANASGALTNHQPVPIQIGGSVSPSGGALGVGNVTLVASGNPSATVTLTLGSASSGTGVSGAITNADAGISMPSGGVSLAGGSIVLASAGTRPTIVLAAAPPSGALSAVGANTAARDVAAGRAAGPAPAIQTTPLSLNKRVLAF